MPATANKNLEQMPNGSNVGTWDVPTNANWGIVDKALGGNDTIALAAANVVLSAAQYENTFLTFTGALLASLTVQFPAVGSFYTVLNLTTNSSAFTVTAITSVSSGRVIALPPGEMVDIMTDGTNVRFKNLGRVGAYWDYAGSSVPAWVSGCTVPPYLNCDGTTFSSATYPALTVILGGTTLPDARGRTRFALNQGTGRITSGSSTGGVDGETLLASGGSETTTLSSQNIPNYSLPVTDPGHTHTLRINPFTNQNFGTAPANVVNSVGTSTYVNTAVTGISVNSGGSGYNFSNLPPAYVGGITMIRSA